MEFWGLGAWLIEFRMRRVSGATGPQWGYGVWGLGYYWSLKDGVLRFGFRVLLGALRLALGVYCSPPLRGVYGHISRLYSDPCIHADTGNVATKNRGVVKTVRVSN